MKPHDLGLLDGADDGNRTRVLSLGTRRKDVNNALKCSLRRSRVPPVAPADRGLLLCCCCGRAGGELSPADPAPPRLPRTGRSARRGDRVEGARRASRSDGAVWGQGSPHCAALTHSALPAHLRSRRVHCRSSLRPARPARACPRSRTRLTCGAVLLVTIVIPVVGI